MNKNLAFGTINYILLGVGIVIIVIGFVLMSGNGTTEQTKEIERRIKKLNPNRSRAAHPLHPFWVKIDCISLSFIFLHHSPQLY